MNLVPMAKMETNSISKVTSNIFFSDAGWEQAAKAKPATDFNYVVMNYHHSSSPDSFVAIEKNQWAIY